MKDSGFILKRERIWWMVDHSIFSVTLMFLLAALLKFSLDDILIFETPLLPRIEGELLDSLITAALGAIAFATFLRLAAVWKRYEHQELMKVATINHSVRNSLQVILGTEMLRSQPAQQVIESVDRIERTLQELYPTVSPSPS